MKPVLISISLDFHRTKIFIRSSYNIFHNIIFFDFGLLITPFNFPFRALGTKLVFVRGEAWEVLSKIINHFDVNKLTFERVVEPQLKIDREIVKKARDDHNVQVHTFPTRTLFDQEELLRLNNNKTPLTMTEFMKIVALAGTPPQPRDAPNFLPPLPDSLPKWKRGGFKIFKEVPTLNDLEEPEEPTTTFEPGEAAAIRCMDDYLRQTERVASFDSSKTNPSSLVPDTTALSPYISLGSLSVRLFYHRLQEALHRLPGPASTRQLEEQLYWRELAYLIGHSTPNFNDLSGNPYCVCLEIPTLGDKRTKGLVGKWARGETGYPVIDACMNQLKRDGWMHYTARHLCASFLTRGKF